MTSTTDKAEHPDVAEISDLTEGLLPADRRDAVRRHLDGCELCADVHASLEEIRGLLRTVPGPPRMPADVAGRIDAALAAEALLHATAPVTDGEDENDVTQAATADGAPLHVSRETSAPSDRPTGRPRSSTTGPGRKPRLRGRSRRAVALGAAFAVAALGLGSVVLSSLNGDGPDEEQRTTTAADTFSEGKLEKKVNDLLARSPEQDKGARSPHTFGMADTPSANPRVLTKPAVPECVQEGIGRNDAALATEQGVYQGRTALLVVLPDASDATHVTAYIVDATCVGNASPSSTAKVLLEHSYAR
ncbi:anti-sigma factor family protein [Streptomyces sp. NRRL S-1314]|uniref:anti-sigma factor family protein n=1 Tax=Streptomyces TaxID=1883 RepID=UPI0004CA41FD|nr:membrane protein [Streptomyces sp. NRRL S-1314]